MNVIFSKQFLFSASFSSGEKEFLPTENSLRELLFLFFGFSKETKQMKSMKLTRKTTNPPPLSALLNQIENAFSFWRTSQKNFNKTILRLFKILRASVLSQTQFSQ